MARLNLARVYLAVDIESTLIMFLLASPVIATVTGTGCVYLLNAPASPWNLEALPESGCLIGVQDILGYGLKAWAVRWQRIALHDR